VVVFQQGHAILHCVTLYKILVGTIELISENNIARMHYDSPHLLLIWLILQVLLLLPWIFIYIFF